MLHLVGHHASTRTQAYPMALTSPVGLYYAGSCRVDTEGPLMIEERQDGSISDSGSWQHFGTVIYCHLCFLGPESFSIIGHHCSSSIILKTNCS